MADNVITTLSIDALPKISSGKVRDLYTIDEKTLLFVASDRISAYGSSDSLVNLSKAYKALLNHVIRAVSRAQFLDSPYISENHILTSA
jgi:phosphoribosylaminoimidazole-succinocarboxamide synthase